MSSLVSTPVFSCFPQLTCRSLQVAMMSRPVAGVRNKTLIVTLPGSTKGAVENLEAILKFLPHACMQAAGQDSRQAHVGGVKQLEKDVDTSSLNGVSNQSAKKGDHSHQHHHSHTHNHDHSNGHGHGHGHKIPKAHTSPSERPTPQSNDPRLGATHRARSSPYPMLTVAEAISTIVKHTPNPSVETQSLSPDLVGVVIAKDIHALEAVPAYRASIVDGYAVIVPDQTSTTQSSTKGTFPVASVSHAQATSLPPPLFPNTIARITTGAPLPQHANAVVMVEDTTIATTTSDGLEEATVTILTSELSVGENIREPGSDIPLHSLILSKGTRIGPVGGEIGMLAASGNRDVPVYRRPRVGVMSTGDEVTDIHTIASPGSAALVGGQIRDSNRPSLLSLLRSFHLCSEVIDLGISRDTAPEGSLPDSSPLEESLRMAFREHDLDIVVTTGGVSMGELDLLKPTVERRMGGTVHFGRVSMKPGKPTTFASVPFKPSDGNMNGGETSQRVQKVIFGLPGNPASALVTAHLFLLPCLQKLAGLPGTGLPRVKVTLGSHGSGWKGIRCDRERVEYHRAVVRLEQHDGDATTNTNPPSSTPLTQLVAYSTGAMQRSSRVGSLAGANALLVLPTQEKMHDGVWDGWLKEGEGCEALLMGEVELEGSRGD